MTNESTEPRNLSSGDTGEDVRELQALLTRLGFDTGATDGSFGPRTDAAVRAYQTQHHLDPDGVVGPATRRLLGQAHAPQVPVILPGRRTADLAGMNAISRLIKFNGTGRYHLGAGDKNPNSPSPFSWSNGVYGCDCIGAVCWALGTPRFRKDFPEYGGWINCDSALMDAGVHAAEGGAGGHKFFEPVDRADVVPGCIVIYPSIRARELWSPDELRDMGIKPTDRIRVGHVGFICGWEGLQDPFKLNETPWDGDMHKLVTLECRATWPAVRMGRNVSFLDGTRYARGSGKWTNPNWAVRFLRYVQP
jgi:hypothetical protein